MNLFVLVWNYLKARPLNTVLNILLLGLGIAVITILLLFNKQLQEKITQNAKGIDLVVGAKGSPMQLILSNIFHVDFPTGNIKLADAERIARNRLVKTAIPLALGDSYSGFRIIGTSAEYGALYDAEIADGTWWSEPMETTLGANAARRLGLSVGATFTSTHGLTTDGHSHEEQPFRVVGVLKPTNSVLDNLILTSIESVWEVHMEHNEGDERDTQTTLTPERPSKLVPSASLTDSTLEITSLLLQYRSPMGAIQMPRLVNTQSALQAASPAFETARLFSILGVGVDILQGFAYLLIFISALSIFIALYNSLKERRYDMAIMRSMGASRWTLLTSVLMEGSFLATLGSLLGLSLGHAALVMFRSTVSQTQMAGMESFVFYYEEWIILVGSLLLGIICAVIPAIQAWRTDISKVLAGN